MSFIFLFQVSEHSSVQHCRNYREQRGRDGATESRSRRFQGRLRIIFSNWPLPFFFVHTCRKLADFLSISISCYKWQHFAKQKNIALNTLHNWKTGREQGRMWDDFSTFIFLWINGLQQIHSLHAMKYYITIIKEEGVHCHLLPLCIFIQRKEITLYLGSAEGNAGQRKQGWSTSPGNRKR